MNQHNGFTGMHPGHPPVLLPPGPNVMPPSHVNLPRPELDESMLGAPWLDRTLAEGRDINPPDTIVGLESGLRPVYDLIESVAPTDAPVLLLGETGSGKELAARTVHRLSRRAAAMMVRVNCGAIPHGLVDSELFGHERGSFTGAAGLRRGWFEQAHGGSLFLDEVAELSLDAQVRLLRVLQEGVLTRVGSERPIEVNVRVVAATHRDLESLVSQGKFREDLWYRLAVFPVRIPPLRTRIQDIPALARHFAAAAGMRIFSRPLQVKADDIQRLVAYQWPGNVRELAAVIERAAILGRGRGLDIEASLGVKAPRQVPSQENITLSATAGLKPPEGGKKTGSGEGFPTLQAVMVAHIQKALCTTSGQIEGNGGAANLLGINPHTLRARMRKLGISWQEYRSV